MVVRGTITGLHDPGGASSARLVTYEVAVAEVFKGKSTATTSLRSAAFGASCGIEVQEGPEYLLFARRVGSDLRTGLCDGTRPVSDQLVTDVEAVTGPGTPVDAPTSTTSPAATPTGTTLAGSTRPHGPGVALPLGVGAAGALLAPRCPRCGGDAAVQPTRADGPPDSVFGGARTPRSQLSAFRAPFRPRAGNSLAQCLETGSVSSSSSPCARLGAMQGPTTVHAHPPKPLTLNISR